MSYPDGAPLFTVSKHAFAMPRLSSTRTQWAIDIKFEPPLASVACNGLGRRIGGATERRPPGAR